MENELGKVRTSTVVLTNGPGAVVDFRADGGPVSAVVCGLDDWNEGQRAEVRPDLRHISEPRLQHKLGVRVFLHPPVAEEESAKRRKRGERRRSDRLVLKAVRFPRWLQCPHCKMIGPDSTWNSSPGKAYRYCGDCTEDASHPTFVVPVRFVVACDHGHLDDFPWHDWVGHEEGCRNRKKLRLDAKSAGISGLELSCPKCGAKRLLEGVFVKETMRTYRCSGARPWMDSDERCDRPVRVLQRGASNVYFPIVESALVIPPYDDRIQKLLGYHYDEFKNVPLEERAEYIRMQFKYNLQELEKAIGESPENLSLIIEKRKQRIEKGENLNLRQEEYRQFTSGENTGYDEEREFEARYVDVPTVLRPYLSHIVRVVRLREVRAIVGFTRIVPPDDADDQQRCRLSERPLGWLPAVEVKGEGIFLGLDTPLLRRWEQEKPVVERAEMVDRAYAASWAGRGKSENQPSSITPRFLLVHTLAHALMRQLTLECGYSSASLRERLYVDEGEDGGAGVLIYTSTSDSDGTLGGLQRQGLAERIESTVLKAIANCEWCSSDPLCISNIVAPSESYSLAACHACVLASETSCEHFNKFLDRGMLTGVPKSPDIGYFSGLIKD